MADHAKPVPFDPDWPEPAQEFFGVEVPDAPGLDLEKALSPRWARAIGTAARSRSTPTDYVFGSALAVIAGLVGNARWAAPTATWQEPPNLWCALVGTSGSAKSPAMDTVLGPLSKLEGKVQKHAEQEYRAWQEGAQIAKAFEKAWQDDVKAAAASNENSSPETTEGGPGP